MGLPGIQNTCREGIVLLKNQCVLGIDVGSVSMALVKMSMEGEMKQGEYAFHHGDIEGTIRRILTKFSLSDLCASAKTASSPEAVVSDGEYDDRLAVMEAVRHVYGRVRGILIVGGENFGFLRFDGKGRYLGYKTNTSCAAGTGSFLDQQAKRLSLESAREMAEIAMTGTKEPPGIATRCSVFAKTDLIHAQQEGYSLEEICAGLCQGVARNLADTLFVDEPPSRPVVCCAGVSKNRAVVDHIGNILGFPLLVHENGHLFGAWGAAMLLARDMQDAGEIIDRAPEKPIPLDVRIWNPVKREKEYEYPPLELKDSAYPDFSGHKTCLYAPGTGAPVEVDEYQSLSPKTHIRVYLGVDIGSTSTKAVLLDEQNRVVAGFYTRTSGRPLRAFQNLLFAMEDMFEKAGCTWKVISASTTGSGRKFIGRIMGADLVLDEITAHARAAVELHPDVDTIIEIGGQDAKFTTLANKRVTFSRMNSVCAAGTGSFIEEQAEKLGCLLQDFSGKTEKTPAPVASNRCTVFMERDLNRLFTEGYTTNEVLAAVLHAVRENYLKKVAVENRIGTRICFQGATAKNRCLVAAFEQKLQKPIHVSRYCHLTGALGAAFCLKEKILAEGKHPYGFRGIQALKQPISLTCETCTLCTNHCKLTKAVIRGETVTYGFLCGRDDNTRQYVNKNTSGFDMLKAVRKRVPRTREKQDAQITIGLPNALYMAEEIPFWVRFFDSLGINTRVSADSKAAVKAGRRLAKAEFCSPMTGFYGHVESLLNENQDPPPVDFVFLPVCLEQKSEDKHARRQFCYYSQYAASLLANTLEENHRKKLLMPLTHSMGDAFHTKMHLFHSISGAANTALRYSDISRAYDDAVFFFEQQKDKQRALYRQTPKKDGDIRVVLLGRPYIALSPFMNKKIPDIFASMGIQVFFQDMIEIPQTIKEELAPIKNELPWHYAAAIMEAAGAAARMEDAYPVLLTSFRCSPDSFVIDYFQKLMEAWDKPYLILQLDDHDLSAGYETRCEAGVRAFRNHYAGTGEKPGRQKPYRCPDILAPKKDHRLAGHTVLLPNWDRLSIPLLAASLRRFGIDARVLEEDRDTITKSLATNTGQCIPLNIIAKETIDYIEKYNLDPGKTILWTAKSSLACNLRLFPHHIRTILAAHGRGMEKTMVYAGTLSFLEVSYEMPVNTYFSFMFGGMLRKMGCKIRPCEKEPGVTDRVIEECLALFQEVFLEGKDKEAAAETAVELFSGIPVTPEFAAGTRKKTAIIGDLYVRDNPVMNQNLIRFIEARGGEVVTTPYSDYLKMISSQYLRKWMQEGEYFHAVSSRAYLILVRYLEKKYLRIFERILGKAEPDLSRSPKEILRKYNLRRQHTGESMDNILKIEHLLDANPDLSLIVLTNPAFCCPSLVTEAMRRKIEKVTGVPMVSLTYDGTWSQVNQAVIPYLCYGGSRAGEEKASLPSRSALVL